MVIKLSEIEELAKLRVTPQEAADFFHISLRKFKQLLEDPDVSAAWNWGQSHYNISLRRKQFKLADTSAPMAIFLGKQVLGQKDTTAHELSGPNQGPIEFDVQKLNPEERSELRQLIERAGGTARAR